MSAAIFMVAASAVSAQDVSKQRRKKENLEKEITILDRQIKDIKTQSSSAVTKLEMLRKNISNRKSLVEESRSMIEVYSDSILTKGSEIVALQADVDTLLLRYEKLIRVAYKYRNPRVWYLYVFASEDVGQAFRRAGYFKNIASQIREDATIIRTKQSALETQKGILTELKEKEEIVKMSLEEEIKNLRVDEKEADKIVQQLKNDRKKMESQVAKKRKEVQNLNREIQKKIEDAQRAKEKSSSKKNDGSAVKLSGEFESNKGKLPWPVNGALVAGFGKQYHPVFTNLELPENEGIDIAVEKGEPVKCVFNGEVLDVFVMPTYGQCVLIQHGKTYFTFYCRMGSLAVKAGDKVTTGQKIGVVEVMGGARQLHFEIWKNKIPQNPANWLRKK